MSTAAEPLQTGVNAVTQGRFSDAIAILESLCNGHLRPPSQDYYQARMWLIRAYKESGQFPQAIKLCRQLATSSHPQVRQWAQKILPELRNPASVSSAGAVALSQNSFKLSSNSKPSNKRLASTRLAVSQTTTRSATARALSQIEADKLLHCGVQAIRRQKYPEAIKSLEAFMRGVATTHPNLNYAQTSLAKAYMGNGQNKLALQLARKLLKSENTGTQAWAQQFIKTHDPRQSDRSLTTQTDHDATPSPKHQQTDHETNREINPRTTSTPTPKSTLKVNTTAQQTPRKQDLSTPILSATCYGSFYAGPILSFFSPLGNKLILTHDVSMVAVLGSAAFTFANWLAPILVAVSILLLSKDRIAKANAQEAINFWITIVCLGLIIGATAGIIVMLSLFIFPPLALLIGILLGLLGAALYIAPLIGLMICLATPFDSVRIPFIWHIVGG
ncbi:MAG: hypothetical protein AAFV72_04820 [Cyanobacteria bacterium J06635_1]